MRVNVKCDSEYNSNRNFIDGAGWSHVLLKEIADKFAYVNLKGKLVIDITCKVVDYYNNEDCCGKTAHNIAKQLRRGCIQSYIHKKYNIVKEY